MARRTHLVGAWPGRGPEHAMEQALQRLAPYLDRLSDGETGDRHLWVTPSIERFRANPDVEIDHDGDWSDYEHVAVFRVRPGRTLDPDNIHLQYALWFENSFPSFKVLRERFGRPDLRFQVGIPLPTDLAVYTFGEAAFADPSIGEACTTAAVREIAAIQASGGDDVVFQLETVVALVAVAQAPDEAQAGTAMAMAANFLDVARRSPEGTRFGIHLCLGDFHHRAYGDMRDVRPIVLLANAIAAGWPGGRVLEFVHAPFAAAEKPPIAGESFYAPLSELTLPAQTRFIAGFLHETLDTDAHRELLARIERLTGREVDVAAACGLGRRDTDEEAFEQMRETAALLETPMTTAGA
ncbi:MAG: hypothetical protein QOG77_685 [Solirubrobacteraceae bacterium]|nr:hypothetical protein [Solirubrobacteraceae bacterium]